MSLHVAISGICSQQRPTWAKYNKSKRIANDLDSNPDSETF